MADNPKAKALITNDTTPVIKGIYDSSDSNGFLTVTVDGNTYTLGTDAELTTNNNTWTLDLSATPALPEGSNTIAVSAQDFSGNPLSTGFASAVTIDTSTPAPTNLQIFGDTAGVESDNFLTEGDIANAYITATSKPLALLLPM